MTSRVRDPVTLAATLEARGRIYQKVAAYSRLFIVAGNLHAAC